MKNEYKYEAYLNGETHLHIVDGNNKVGRGIYCINLLSGDKPLEKKDGTKLINISGTCADVCDKCHCDEKCYAIRQQIYKSTKWNLKSWADNTLLAVHEPEKLFQELGDFLNHSMVSGIRFHSFGEIPSKKYLKLIISTANKYPNVQFYFYTKRYEWIEEIIQEDGKLPDNLAANMSIWHKNYSNPYGLPEFILDDGTDEEVAKLPHCPAVDKKGFETGVQCIQCKRCVFAKPGQKTAVYEH